MVSSPNKENSMSEKVKHDKPTHKPKISAPCRAPASPYRTLLIAASMGVIIGLLLKR